MRSLRRAAARRVIGALALAAAGLAPAAGASAALSVRGPTAPASAPAAALRFLHLGVRLVDVPVDEANNPRAYQYIIDFLPTGSVIHRRIMVINEEHQTATFTVYPDAARISGGMFIGEAGRTSNELTGWITVQHPSVTLGPERSTMDLVTIRVPPGATRGEHYGVVWTEQSVPVRSSGGLMLKDVARVGVRVYLAVGRGGAPPTSFTITSVTARQPDSSHPMLVAHVRNTGGRAVDLTGKAMLTSGPGGTSAGPFNERQTVTLAPGQSGDAVFPLPATLPAGSWVATVTLVSGVTTATARASVAIGGQPTAASWMNAATAVLGGGLMLALIVIGTVIGSHVWRLRRAPA